MQGKEKQLIKNTIIVGVGKVCTQFISFFLLPLYTSLLSAEEYGIVDLLNTYVALLIPIFFFQSDQAVFRFLIDVRDQEEEKKNILTNCAFATMAQFVVYMLCCVTVGSFLKNEYMLFLAANVVLSMGSNLLLQISRGLGDNMTYSVGSLISGAGTVILNVVFIAFLKMGAVGILTATMLGNLMCILYVFFRKQIYSYIDAKRCSWPMVKALWKYSLPLVPNQLSWWIVNTSDRLIINWVIGIASNGIYSAANKFSTIVITVFNIFNLTWTESAALHIKDGDSEAFFTKIFNSTLRLFIALSFGVIAFMPFIFKLLITGDGYASAYQQIPVLMLSTIFNVMVALLGSVYVALKKTGEIAKTSLFSAVINIAVNVALINQIGLYAASISTFVSYFAMAMYRIIDVQKYVKIKVDQKMIAVSIVVGAVIVSIYYIRNMQLCVIGALLSVIYALYYNIDTLKSFIPMIRTKLLRKQ